MSRRTWLVECYGPGIGEASVAAAGDRARAAVEIERAGGAEIDYLGALVMPTDEAVFHAFAAPDQARVAEASTRAGLHYERIVESVAVQAPSLVDALARLLGG
ncbi:MAG TPA: hypothetical protein VF484_01360 [Candidatus Limnocylindrales bacterium]